MFHHVVLMKFTSAADESFYNEVEAYAAQIRRSASELRRYVFERNMASRNDGLTYGIISSFDNSAAHDRYQESPIHQRMKNYMLPFIERIVVCDIDEARK